MATPNDILKETIKALDNSSIWYIDWGLNSYWAKAQAERAAWWASLTRWQKIKWHVSSRWSEARHRVSHAWDALRGRECD